MQIGAIFYGGLMKEFPVCDTNMIEEYGHGKFSPQGLRVY